MKTALKIIFIVVLGLILYGTILNNVETKSGEKWIGFGVLLFAFVLMPLFIYHRYKGKDLTKYSIRQPQKKEEEKD